MPASTDKGISKGSDFIFNLSVAVAISLLPSNWIVNSLRIEPVILVLSPAPSTGSLHSGCLVNAHWMLWDSFCHYGVLTNQWMAPAKQKESKQYILQEMLTINEFQWRVGGRLGVLFFNFSAHLKWFPKFKIPFNSKTVFLNGVNYTLIKNKQTDCKVWQSWEEQERKMKDAHKQIKKRGWKCTGEKSRWAIKSAGWDFSKDLCLILVSG